MKFEAVPPIFGFTVFHRL